MAKCTYSFGNKKAIRSVWSAWWNFLPWMYPLFIVPTLFITWVSTLQLLWSLFSHNHQTKLCSLPKMRKLVMWSLHTCHPTECFLCLNASYALDISACMVLLLLAFDWKWHTNTQFSYIKDWKSVMMLHKPVCDHFSLPLQLDLIISCITVYSGSAYQHLNIQSTNVSSRCIPEALTVM